MQVRKKLEHRPSHAFIKWGACVCHEVNRRAFHIQLQSPRGWKEEKTCLPLWVPHCHPSAARWKGRRGGGVRFPASILLFIAGLAVAATTQLPRGDKGSRYPLWVALGNLPFLPSFLPCVLPFRMQYFLSFQAYFPFLSGRMTGQPTWKQDAW